MEVYLIRHTTPEVDKGICYGQTNLELKDTCISEFEAIVKQIPQKLDAFYSSPLKRCTLLASHLSPLITTDDRLKEYNFGSWEMKRWDDIPKSDLDPWMSDFVNQPPPGGETMLAMSERVKSFFEDLLRKEYSKVAVISHSVVMRIALCFVEGKPLEKAFERKLGYGEVIRVEMDKALFSK